MREQIAELQKLIRAIDDKFRAIPERPLGEKDAYEERRNDIRKVAGELLKEHGFAFREQWDGSAVRALGIRSTCAAGLKGAFLNWRAAAERKIEQLRGAQ